jgi:uncharacterized membrane protein
MLMTVAGLMLDGTNLYLNKRKLQGATDLAAIAAAGSIDKAQAAATATLGLNGFTGAAISTLEFGVYSADPSLSTAQRFVPQASGGNAVRLTTQIAVRPFFGNVLSMNRANAAPSTPGNTTSFQTQGMTVAVGAHAIAMQNNQASFAIGSRLLGLNGGIENALLGALLGANLSLSVMDYQSLASANIDVFEFNNALATRLHMTAATYDQVAAASVQPPTVLAAMADAIHGNAQAQAALQTIASAALARTITVAPLVSYGPFGSMTAAVNGPLTATVSALDMLTALAQVSNGTSQVQVNLGASVPGLVGATLQLGIGQRPVGSGLVSVGAPGATIHTAQTRLLLTVTVGPVLESLVSLPVYIELASGTATLSSVLCSPLTPSNVSVTLGVTPAVVSAAIGSIPASAFTNYAQPPAVTPATLATIAGAISVTGSASAAMTNNAPTAVVYSAADIAAGTRKTTSTTNYTSSLTSSLLNSLNLQTQVLGLGLGLPTNVGPTVATALGGATGAIDQVIAGVTSALGIGLGQADTWVTGTRCGGAVLVN